MTKGELVRGTIATLLAIALVAGAWWWFDRDRAFERYQKRCEAAIERAEEALTDLRFAVAAGGDAEYIVELRREAQRLNDEMDAAC